MAMRSVVVLLLLALTWAGVPGRAAAEGPLPIKAVVVTFWQVSPESGDAPGERHLWFQSGDFTEHLPFPLGEWDLGYHPARGTLLLTTGVGDVKAATAVMALGTDPRFDLSKAYFLLCGIAGGDPLDVSLGSVALPRYVIDHDLSYFIDPRELSPDFPTGFLPIFRTRPYEEPPQDHDELYRLNPHFVDFAWEVTKGVPLETSEALKAKRERYRDFPNARKDPFVVRGDALCGNRFWHGELSNAWANEWTRYFTGGEGNYMVSAMEDAGALRALQRLGQAGKVNPDRVVIFRAVSGFTMQWKGASAYESLLDDEGGIGVATGPATRNVHAVGAELLRVLLGGASCTMSCH
ncbi:MAG TPA: purine nucleoside permease [Synergistaceae bacterium]|nr:purine nucleoside permease [Synergistaceae bacterium]